MKIYTASPLGFSEAGRYFLYEKLIPSLESAGAETIDPWNLTPQHQIDGAAAVDDPVKRKAVFRQLNTVIGKNNADGIERADCVVAVLDGADIDSGTAAEIGFAFAKNKIIIGYRNDFRLSSDNEGSTVNLQVEYFITASGGRIVSSLNELTALVQLFAHKK
jgi:nucleoside 2-deoxyribosyltransferase